MADPLRPSDPPPAPTLEYGRPQKAMPPALQWCLGIVLSVVLVLTTVTAGFRVHGHAGFFAGTLRPLLVPVLLVFGGILVRRRAAYRPLAAGIWTGIAVAALIYGLCLVAWIIG